MAMSLWMRWGGGRVSKEVQEKVRLANALAVLGFGPKPDLVNLGDCSMCATPVLTVRGLAVNDLVRQGPTHSACLATIQEEETEQ